MKKNDLILFRTLEIETWHIQGSVAKAQNRKEMMLVLRYLEEFPDSGAKALAGHLLFEERSRLVIAERLLSTSEQYELTESERGRYTLTEKGKKALATEEVFIPEDGCWRLAVCNDPLLPHKVIEIEVFEEPSAKSELIGKNSRKILEDRKQKIKQIPGWIKECIGLEVLPHLGGNKVRIDIIEKKAERVSAAISIKLEWNVSKGSIRLLNKDNVVNQFKGPGLGQTEVWETLLDNEELLDDWDSRKNSLAVLFDHIDDESRKSMAAGLEFNSPEIPAYGQFTDLVVQQVPLRAASISDAEQWANWRLHEAINGFATIDRYQQWVCEASASFSEFGIALPERDELAQELLHKSAGAVGQTKKWHMIAAFDWSL